MGNYRIKIMGNYRIAVPVIGPNIIDLSRQGLRAVQQGASILEFRMDCMKGVDSSHLKFLFKQRPKIITNRHSDEAGPDERFGWKGNEKGRIDLLQSHAEYVPAFIDIELEHFAEIERDRAKTSLIVSYHNFNETPGDNVLEDIFNRAVDKGANLVKIVTMTNNADDSRRLLDFTERKREVKGIIILGMGEYGRETRIHGHTKGSYLTYACLDGEATAPGQTTIKELRECWNKTQ